MAAVTDTVRGPTSESEANLLAKGDAPSSGNS